MFQEIIIDTRELEAPEPMTVVLNALSQLDEKTSLKMIHRMEPLMLYTTLENNNINYKVVSKNDDVFIYIWDDSFKNKELYKDMN